MKKQMLFILGMVCALTFGQEVPNISPPTPEAAALGKFIDIPVSLHTGTPNISIPIVNIAEQEINIPVSLNYHASGIKVNEIASRVGLGWALNAGGMITRNVRGIADDDPQGFINTSNTVSNYFTSNASEKNLLFQNAIDGHQDYESDVYYFNYPGGSGKFFFDQNGGIYSHPKNDLIINYTKDNSNKIVGWEITTETGLIYTFGTIPGTLDTVLETKQSRIRAQNQNLPSAINFYTSGWYLTQIKDHKGNRIRFNYTRGTNEIEYWNILEQKKYIQASLNGDCTTPGVSLTFSEDRYFPTYLTSIVTPKGSIHFDYTISRTDLKNDKALSKIELKDTNNKIVDRYLFEYGYFTTSAWEHFGNYGDLDQRTKKLYLQKIKQQKGNTINQEHNFTYYQEHPFPERFSFDRDFWDYANGVDNQYLYPEFAYTTNTGPVHVDGGDRTVDESHAQTLLLKEIEYPTKGKTEFVYESNTVSGGAAFFAGNRLTSKLIIGSQVVNSNVPGETVSSNFTLNESGIVSYRTSFSQNCLGDPTRDCPTIKITKANGDLVLTFRNANETGVMDLEAGTYTISIKNGPFLSDGAADISFYKQTIENDNNNPSNVAKTGGLRIKEMRFKDDNGTILNTKKYTYNQFDNTGLSSGLSLNPPVFLIKNAPFRQGPNSCFFNVIQSNSIFPFNGQSTYHVGYTNVTAYNTDKEQGKTEYTYSFFADAGGFGSSNEYVWSENFYPFAPAVDYSHRRGLLIREKTYKYNKDRDTFDEVEEIYNTYKKQGDIRIDNIAMGYVGSAGAGYLGYDNLSERYLLEQTQKTNQYNSGAVKTTIQYGYDSGYQGRTMPIQTTTTDSNAETVVTKSYYPDDVISTTALGKALTTAEYNTISKLKKKATQHRIAAPIQQETYINGELTSRQRTKYKDWNTSIVLPEIVQSAKGDATLQDRIEYLDYDTNGNPLEVSQVDGRHIMYVWGYNNTQPIVKIDNASYTGIPAAVTTLINQLKTTSDTEDTAAEETTMRTLFKNLREHAYFANAQVSGYTYDPLIGLTSMTNPQGQTAYYRYDDMNRMQYALDQDQHVVEQVRYNYQGQQSDALGGVIIDTPGDQPKVPNQPATFTANTSGSGSANLYTWSVNGAQEQCGSGVSFTKTFTSEGTYEVKVLAYNTETKHRVSHTMSVIVKYPELTTPLVNANYTHIVKGTNVDFSASSIGGGTGNLRYEWYLNNVKQTSTTTTFRYNPNTAGTYNVYFKVIDNESGKSVNSAIRKLYAYHPLNTPNVSASKAHIERGTTTTFTASNIGGGSGSRRYEWYVNNVKQSATGTSYSYHFPNTGTYTIKFKVVDLTMQNANAKWGANSPVLKVYPKMVVSTSQSATSVSGSSASVSFNVTGISGGSGSRQTTWRAFKAVSPSQTAGSGTGTQFSFSNFATGTHEYNITATVKDNLTGKQVTRLMVVVSSISDEDCPNCGPQH
ncbi:PKD domain-containing protein [Aquimarina algiphila]|uniref:PKD domain-containing protein n=1 Tax=Aquimarina algiphila TaxID=2047982 RepID=UPI002330F622|nr:PKD domain-containing protein [Aquimarina algiphila]